MHSAGVSSAIQDLKKDKDGLGSKEKTCLDVLHLCLKVLHKDCHAALVQASRKPHTGFAALDPEWVLWVAEFEQCFEKLCTHTQEIKKQGKCTLL